LFAIIKHRVVRQCKTFMRWRLPLVQIPAPI
jgi:hypothetical protein